ncbi:MAG: MATE family efflux transporter [Opitutales bacterium]
MASNLTEVRKTLWLALPMVIGQVASQLMHVTDLAMVGRVGVVELAGAAFGNNVFNIVWLIGIGPVTAMSILVGEAHGGGREHRARTVLRHGLLVVGAFALFLGGGLAWVVLGSDIWHLGQPEEVIAAARTYLLFLASSTLPLLLFIVFKAYSEARGWPWLPFWFNAGSILLNIFLNWVFIYGNLGAPRLELAGAGLATVLSRVVALVALALFMRASARTQVRWPLAEWGQFDPRLGLDVVKLGIPIGLQILFEVGAFNCAVFMIGWLPDGTVSIAAHSIAINLTALAFMVPLGVMFAASIRVGQARGAGNQAQARQIGWSTIGVAVGFMACVALTFVVGREWLPYLFLSEDVGDRAGDVVALASSLLLLAAAFAIFDGAQVTAIGVLRGFRDVRWPTLMTFVAYWVICLPLGFWLAFHFDGREQFPGVLATVAKWLPEGPGLGPHGVWIGLCVGIIAICFAVLVRFHIIGNRAVKGDA